MNTTQVRITIPNKLKNLATQHASQYGLTLSGFIKNIIIQEVKSNPLPTKNPSTSTLKTIKEGNQEFTSGKTKFLPIDNLDEFINTL